MKKTLITLLVVLTGVWAQATLYPLYTINSGSFSGGTIADGNPVGQSFTGTVTAQPWERVVAAAVTLNITGGYNSDLYAYLIAPNGTVMMLMNQASGLAGTGMNNVTLTAFALTGNTFNVTGTPPGTQSLQASTDPAIQTAAGTLDGSGRLTGTYQPIDSMLYGPAANNSLTQAQYLGLPSAAGEWTLFMADMVTDDVGNGNHTLNNWSLDLAVVPEPVGMALGLFAAMLLALAGLKRFWVAKTAG
jgi:subtilisin-like proprotein convertase family protein